MAKPPTNSGNATSPASGIEACPEPVEGPKTYAVSHPLSPSRISWLRQQSKHVAEVSKQQRSEHKTKR